MRSPIRNIDDFSDGGDSSFWGVTGVNMHSQESWKNFGKIVLRWLLTRILENIADCVLAKLFALLGKIIFGLITLVRDALQSLFS